MTFRQSRKHVMRTLIGWHRPPVVTTVTTNNGQPFTLRMLKGIMGFMRQNAHPPVHIVLTPQMAELFSETTIDQSLYGTLRIVADPTMPSGEAYMIQSPNP